MDELITCPLRYTLHLNVCLEGLEHITLSDDSKLKYNKFLFPELYMIINHNNPSTPPTIKPNPIPDICVHPLINLVTASIVNNEEINKIIPILTDEMYTIGINK